MTAIDVARDALDDYHGYVASDPTEPDKPAYAALADLEALANAIAAWDATLSEYCDGPERDAVRAALARVLGTEQDTA